MKKIFLFLAMALVGFSSFAATEEASSKDSEIVAFIMVLNKNEIAAADLTKHKKANKAVEGYADLMIKEHSKNLMDTEKLSKEQKIAPVDSEMVVSLRNKGEEEITTLTPLVGKAYEVAYIDAMVKGHTDALASIDTFLKEVKNPELKTFLEGTRTHVKHHLAKAQAIQKELK